MRVVVQPAPFDPAEEMTSFTNGLSGAGAVVTFTGIVRSDNGLTGMEIEQYPGMTQTAITGMVDQATQRWALVDALVIHRHGTLQPKEAIMMVATAAPHRGDAFAAAEFLMDYLKSRAPFWKKEISAGGEAWVAAKEDDEAALRRW
jgi:molybdopterin synthase catalytic subunit